MSVTRQILFLFAIAILCLKKHEINIMFLWFQSKTLILDDIYKAQTLSFRIKYMS